MSSLQLSKNNLDQKSFWLFAALSILVFVASAVLYNPLPVLLPFGILFLAFAVRRPRHLIYLFFAVLPFSIEIHTSSIGTDLPSEPMMLLMTAMTFVLLLVRIKKIPRSFLLNPISIVLACHILWIAFASLFSTNPVFSFKFLLAKIWYVTPFYLLSLLVMHKAEHYTKLFKCLGVGLFIAIVYVLVRHAAEGFSFASSNTVMRPIFRNHVNYAIMLVAFLPYYWHIFQSSKKSYRWVHLGLLLLLLTGIYFSYTRAAQLSVFLAIGFYFVIKFRLVKLGVAAALSGLVIFVMFMSQENKYLDFAPDFSKTIAHKKFDNLVEATTKMEDISTVERFYRWVAGGYMVAERPWTGFGPSTFYTSYDGYTVTSYQTYVSDNPEKSGIHNNYLMVAVEQGIPGLIFMLLVAFVPLLYAEKIYHRLTKPDLKSLLLAAATCYFIIGATILINDLLEADKIGPLYYLSAAIIASIGHWTENNDGVEA